MLIFEVMAREKHESVTVGFIALGCPKNVVDSEKMLALIVQAGYVITAEPENADVVVINTCGFIAPAIAEALEAIEHAVVWKAGGTVKKVIVAGCLPERLGRELFDRADGIDAIVGLGQRDAIARIIRKTLTSRERAVYLDHPRQTIRDDRADCSLRPPTGRILESVRAVTTPTLFAQYRQSEADSEANHSSLFSPKPLNWSRQA